MIEGNQIHVQICLKAPAALFFNEECIEYYMRTSEREVKWKLDMFRIRKIYKTAPFSFGSLIIYVLHSEGLCLTMCTPKTFKNDWIRVRMTRGISIYLNYLGQNQRQWLAWTNRTKYFCSQALTYCTVVQTSRIQKNTVNGCLICEYFDHLCELL